jgi:outer membrane protein assembly factor BamB
MPLPAFRPRAAAVSLLLLLVAAFPAAAVISILLPLKRIIEEEQLIFVAVVDKVDPDRPAAVFKVDEKLKGDPPFDRLPVNLTGDPEANKKEDHRKLILDRLEAGRKVVVFAHKRGKKYEAMGFVEGTWFSVIGTIDEDGKTVRWAFQNCEPYLRRTFKGTTAELKKVVEDALAKKAEPPAPNEKEPPGYGPPVQKKPEECGTRNAERGTQESVGSGFHSALRAPRSALLGVIPSFVLVGPLAVIAALFPGVAARLAVGMKRWRAFLVVASINSTLAILYYFGRTALPDWWVFGDRGFLALLLVSTTIGLGWAGRRYRRLAAEDAAVTRTPTRSELTTLAGLTLLVGLIVASTRLFAPWAAVLEIPMREFTFIGVGLLVATLYAAYRAATPTADRLPDGTDPSVRLSLSGESVGLGTLFLCGLVAVLAAGHGTRTVAIGTQTGDADDTLGPKLADDVRVFEIPEAHQVFSGVTLAGDRLYLGAGKQTGFGAYGFVFCLDRDTGRTHWKFDADEELKPVFCTPTVADGRLFVGEGLHTDKKCRLFCLDTATGKPAWSNPFETTSHTEGTPRVVNGKVYFTAGDDGLFCADAATGAKRWQFAGHSQALHIDGPPAVAGNRVFVGSGLYTLALLCVDAESGKELWRTPVNLRSFGTPLVLGNRVAYGLGTGNLTSDVFKYDEEKDRPAETTPAGAVVCVEADTGKEAWRYELGRSVHTPLAADAFNVYATSRDGAVHCLDRRTGKLRWKTGIGATITAGPAVATAGGYPVAVYAVSTDGMMVCLNPQTGKVNWGRNLREHTGREVKDVFSTPTVVTTETPTGSRRVVYVGAQLTNPNNKASTAAVFRFEDELGGE